MKNKEYIDSILDDQEKLAVQMFIENNVQREAVKKVLLVDLYQNGTLQPSKPADPLRNFALGLVSNRGLELNNEQIGATLRAQWEGVQILEVGFSNMAAYKRDDVPKKVADNPAR